MDFRFAAENASNANKTRVVSDPDRTETALARDDEIDGLRPFTLLVGLDVEGDVLSLVQGLEPGLLDRGDVHENVAPAVVGLDEAVAAFCVEELDDTCHGHR